MDHGIECRSGVNTSVLLCQIRNPLCEAVKVARIDLARKLDLAGDLLGNMFFIPIVFRSLR